MPTCYQLIGVPAAGKSTWVNQQDWLVRAAYISTDKFVEAYAHEVNKTYTEVFNDIMPQAVKMMAAEVAQARTQLRDIVWDQTSTTRASRLRKFNMLLDYQHIAVVFKTPDQQELTRRLNLRIGKTIPQEVIERITQELIAEPPDEEEGFREIWYV